MPIYEYSCPKCGEFEQRQSMSDPTLKRCPTCRSKVTKLISASAFQLKGGGWYSDAYQKKSGSSATPASKEKSAPAADSSSTSSESAPSSATTPSSTPSSSTPSGSTSGAAD